MTDPASAPGPEPPTGDEPVFAMMDASCQKCGKRFGWRGSVADAPPCPRCGTRIPGEALARDEALIRESREMLWARTPETRSGRAERVWVQDWEPSALVYVGRVNASFPDYDGLWANPWSHSAKLPGVLRVGTPAEAVSLYREWLTQGSVFDGTQKVVIEPSRRLAILRRLPELRGKRLGCWRHSGPCHAEVLAEMANALPPDPRPKPGAGSAGPPGDVP